MKDVITITCLGWAQPAKRLSRARELENEWKRDREAGQKARGPRARSHLSSAYDIYTARVLQRRASFCVDRGHPFSTRGPQSRRWGPSSSARSDGWPPPGLDCSVRSDFRLGLSLLELGYLSAASCLGRIHPSPAPRLSAAETPSPDVLGVCGTVSKRPGAWSACEPLEEPLDTQPP